MKIPPILIAIAIASVSVLAAAYPIVVKGEPTGQNYLTLIQARNKALAGTYAYESVGGIYLSSQHAGTDAVQTAIPNALTTIIYAKVFQWFGFDQWLPIFVSMGLFALSSVIVYVLGSRLFDTVSGAVMGFLFALMPIVVSSASTGGFYEFGMFFFVMGLYCYLGSRRGPFSAPWWRLVSAGVLFAMSALARNAFAASLVPLVGYDLFVTRSLKRFAFLAVPILLLFGSTLTSYSWIGVGNGYFGSQDQPFQQVGHFFNDPYSAVYDREASIRRMYETPGAFDRIAVRFASQWGLPVTPAQRLQAIWGSLTYYLSEMIPPWEFGGPLIIILALGGYLVLWRKNKQLAQLVATWLVLWLVYLVYDNTANWDHYLEILFPVVLCVALAITWLQKTLVAGGLRPILASSGIVLAVVGTLVYGAKWRFSQQYANQAYRRGVVARQIVSDYKGKGTIAVGIHNEVAYAVAYSSNRDIIYFHPDTVQRLADEKTLKAVFKKYGVTLAVGFDASLSSAAGVPVIPVP